MRPTAILWLVFALGGPPAQAQAQAQRESNPAADDVESAFEDAFSDFDEAFEDDSSKLVFSGFIEGAYGRRLDADANFASRQTLGDLRGRIETEWSNDELLVTLKGDLLYDDYVDDLEIEPRDFSVKLSPAGSVDLKLGRQVLTWGTGDLLFLNDLFPKSWVSFFAGRDDEYLKAPSDAVRATWYTDRINVDVVWSPEFEPDDYLTGDRFSFFSPLAGAIIAPRPPLSATEPGNAELAMRVFRTVGSTEYAGYAYRGFFKRPLGLTPGLEPTFPELSTFGGSLRRPLGGGLVNAEVAYFDSREDRDGTNPLVPNDQLRLLTGYEFEARTRLNLGFQVYIERTLDYTALIANSPSPLFEPARTRTVLTNRLTYRGERERLTLSLFTFYSISDDDYYLRPVASFRQSDNWTFTAGANLFGGDRPHTFFGQLEDNSNAYFRARFNY